MPAIYLIDKQTVFVTIPKNASRAVLEAAGAYVEIDDKNRDNFKSTPSVVLWRNPQERMESAYRMWFAGTGLGFLIKTVSLFPDWVMACCDGTLSDMHTEPQYDICIRAYGKMPDTVIKWDFDALATLFGVQEIRNDPSFQSKPFPTPWTQEATDAFAIAYAKDIEIWGAA